MEILVEFRPWPRLAVKGLKRQLHCHFIQVWQRQSCNDEKNLPKSVLHVQSFCFACIIKPVSLFIFLVSFVVLVALSSLSSVTTENNSWYVTILPEKLKKPTLWWKTGDEIDPCFSFFRLLLFFFLSFWLQISFTFILSDYVGFPSLTYMYTITSKGRN